MWVKLDDKFPRHPKVRACSLESRWLFVVSICHVAEFLTNGFLSDADAAALAAEGRRSKAAIDDLVDHGLWQKVPGGFQIHDYLDYNPPAAAEIEKREARKKAGRIGGQKSAAARIARYGSAQPNAEANPEAIASTVAQANSEASPNPVPVFVPTERTKASPNGDARLPELSRQVKAMWKARQGWDTWPPDRRFDAMGIEAWLKRKPYPVEFWRWALPQVPADTRAFVRLTTPLEEGKVCWLEEHFIRWREARYERVKHEPIDDIRGVDLEELEHRLGMPAA